MAKRKKHEWTVIEDFYLRAHLGVKSVAEIATDLGLTEPQVQDRVDELGITPDTYSVKTKGFIMKNGMVTMTGARSKQDDDNATPVKTDLNKHPKLKNSSSKLY